MKRRTLHPHRKCCKADSMEASVTTTWNDATWWLLRSPDVSGCLESVEKYKSKTFHQTTTRLQNLSYGERLNKLKLKSLEHRRLIVDLITGYNTIYNNITITTENFLKFSPTLNLRGHSLKLITPLARNNTQKHFFTYRIIKAWNSLPDKIVTLHNTKSFKHAINNLDLSKYLVGPTYISPPSTTNPAHVPAWLY